MATEISMSPKAAEFDDHDDELELIQNKATVEKLYEALSRGEAETVAKLIAGDLEYWFHGPPRCHHMMRVLTGESPTHSAPFRFEPRSVTAVGGACVIAEGWEGAKAYWVHVWTVKDDVITQFREYFNTWLTVRDLRPSTGWEVSGGGHHRSLTLWQSMPRDLFRRSLPGLLLAI
ncbi:NTF2-like domain containing protein [Parasponia andersonii]|uniref:NTF2-like domain containing protein n=1 Tax=Parasponia andersonii TaxID=3476 RepID=A0A2P5BXQ7_PARAD|nr:NTF2-like domain containing protein [Parasponia andersonii]